MKHSSIKQTKDSNVSIRLFLLSIYVFLSFYEHFLNLALASVTKYYVFGLIVMVMLTANKLNVRNYHYSFILWLGYKFLSLAWTPSYTIFGFRGMSEVICILLLITITALDECDDLLTLFEKAIWICSVSFGILSIFFSTPYEGLSSRLVLTLLGVQFEPNNGVAFLMCGYAISLHHLLFERKKTFLHAVALAITAYTSLMTGSRAGFLTLIGVTIFGFLSAYNPKNNKKAFSRIFVTLIFLFVASTIVLKYLPEATYDRLFTFEEYEGGSERDVMWRDGLNLLLNPIHLLMGAGWGGYGGAGGHGSLHNTFLAMLCEVGMIGTITFFAPVFYALIKMFKKGINLPLFIFIANMIPAFFIEAINKRFFWNAIIYVLVAYNCYNKQLETVTDITETETTS